MPVSTAMLGASPDPPANCPECGTKVLVGGNEVTYWPLRLDHDLLDTIASLYPHWFKDCNLNDLAKMAEMASNNGKGTPFIPLSPPKCEVDDSPLQGKMLNKNKESLKVKLMLRRPREDLISRGVLPAMNTPAAFYEQRQKLDMAKKHDFLKHKIQRRPDREELVRQHILEDSPGNIDPSLVEKQKQLKRARIADAISDHLCQRPGPLELIRANILHTSEDLEKAVKEGQLMFKSTSEGEHRKLSCSYPPVEDDSSSEGMSPEQGDCWGNSAQLDSGAVVISKSLEIGSVSSPPPCSGTSICDFATPSPSFTSTSSLSPLSSLASPQHTSILASPQTSAVAQTLLVTRTPLHHALSTPPQQNSAPGKDQASKNRKKSKGKMQPKARTIKFHEYKGPPSAIKRDNGSNPETSYEIRLQQQQLFLQCQLELKQKYPQIILPAAMKPAQNESTFLTITPSSSSVSLSSVGTTATITRVAIPTPPPPPLPPPDCSFRTSNKFEDMKVSDLKAELKKRSLPVSGAKPQLIERLRSYNVVHRSISRAKVNAQIVAPKNVTINKTMEEVKPQLSTSDTIVITTSASPISTPSMPLQLSLDLGDEPSSVLETAMDLEDGISSPAYSYISAPSTRPSSTAPMDIDFDATIDSKDLGSLISFVHTIDNETADDRTDSINTPPPPPPPLPMHLSTNPSTSKALMCANVNVRTSAVQSSIRVPTPPPMPSNANMGTVVQLQKRIGELERELQHTQMQLQQQVKNMADCKPTQKLLIQQRIQSKQHQQQLQNFIQQNAQLQLLSQEHENRIMNNKFDLLLQEQQKARKEAQAFIAESLLKEGQKIKLENGWDTVDTEGTRSQMLKSHRSGSVSSTNRNTGSNSHHRASSLPDFHGLLEEESIQRPTNSSSNNINLLTKSHHPQQLNPPPNYEEAVKDSKNYRIVNSDVDDLLEILIKNGELPMSAIQTPGLPHEPLSISLSNTEIFSIKGSSHPPPPPPPPPPRSNRQLPYVTWTSNPQSGDSLSSQSLFADLVMDRQNPSHMDLSLVLDELQTPIVNPSSVPSHEDNNTLEEMRMCPLDVKMELGDDVESWLDSLVKVSQNHGVHSPPWMSNQTPPATCSHGDSGVSSGRSSSGGNSSCCSSTSSCGMGVNQSDPLLGNNHNQLDIFSLDEFDLHGEEKTSDLSWDCIDFAT